jgi:hypothetical protein
MNEQRFPAGWDEQLVQRLLAEYADRLSARSTSAGQHNYD